MNEKSALCDYGFSAFYHTVATYCFGNKSGYIVHTYSSNLLMPATLHTPAIAKPLLALHIYNIHML